MTGPAIFPDDVRVRGAVIARSLTLETASLTSDMIVAGADVDADKLEHRHSLTWGQPNSAATTETRVIHLSRTIGIIRAVSAGSIVAAIGNSTVTVDVMINGVSALSSVITLDNANTAYVPEVGTVDGAADDLAVGGVVTVVITATVGTGTLPTGVFVNVEVDEAGV